MTATKISLCAVPYEVTNQDGQVIFEEKSGFYGSFSRFTFEWTGCGWYLVDFDSTFGHLFVPHIAAAFEYVKENYSIEYTNGVGAVKFRPVRDYY